VAGTPVYVDRINVDLARAAAFCGGLLLDFEILISYS
jgi:hypothetical protein